MKDTVTSERFDLLEPGNVLLSFKDEFDDLGQDVYHPAETGGRSRRLAQHYATFDPTTGEANVTRLKTQLFLQGETNKLTGHIARPIEPTRAETDMTPYIKWGFRQIQERFPLDDLEREWLVNTHLIRTHALPTKAGVPVPEGVHQDGVDFLIMGAVSRENIEGGVSTVHRSESDPPIFETTLMPGQAILIDDSQLFHMASSVVPKSGGAGHRDMILMGFHFWSRDHYRYDWKDNIYVAE
jgi:hypothetical protein